MNPNNKQAKQKPAIDDPDFYKNAFDVAVQQRNLSFLHEGDNFKRVCADEYNELSKRLDRSEIQESCSVRNVLRTRRLAKLLINEQGIINLSVIPKLLVNLKKNLHSLGPNRQYDSKRNVNTYHALTYLAENKQAVNLIQSVDKPLNNPKIDQLIRDTLSLSSSQNLTNAHARRAVLSAWLCTLRQNVGSCFATAPGIIVHDEQPDGFLNDLISLISTGQLKRTFGGVEYSVPLSLSWGAGDLKKRFPLQLGSDFEESTILASPGLEAAFESAKLIDANQKGEAKLAQIKTLIRSAFKETEDQVNTIWTSAEEIIRNVLLNMLNLTNQDISDYENRPKAMIYGSLMMQSTKESGKTGLCSQFVTLFSQACDAFKGLSDNALLKAWEFSLASFAETKAQFTKWNLYSSLGMEWQEPSGIGSCIYAIVQNKLNEANQKVADMQYEYEQVFQQLKTMESRMQGVSSEREGQWLRVEYQSKRNEFYTLEQLRNTLSNRAHILANLYQVLIERYDGLFPSYFQEVYDADMHDVTSGPYDDSPAGFRLLYKHGRANISQWSYIKTPTEFVEALVAFFTSTENEIVSLEETQGLQEDVSAIITAIVSHLRTKEFLETAFYRMAAAHQMPIVKDPLNHLEKIEKKPWAYTSGGTMSTLVSCYYKLNDKPTEVNRWVDNTSELCAFLVDTMKSIAPKIMERYLGNSATKSMLIHSPTHAFLLKPGLPIFKSAWQSDVYTYTWIKDKVVVPQKSFYENLWLDEEMMNFLIDRLTQTIPQDIRHYFKKTFSHLYGNKHPSSFRALLAERLLSDKGFIRHGYYAVHPDQIDSMLFTLLPLFHRHSLKERIQAIFSAIPIFSEEDKVGLLKLFDELSSSSQSTGVMGANELQDICKGLICLYFNMTHSEVDFHALISATAQNLGFASPAPFIFADTNWVKDEFGFVVNPGTGEFELWRVDITGRVGFPMSPWKKWLDGSHRQPTWGVCNRPYEYSYSPSQMKISDSGLINKMRFLPEKKFLK